MKTKFKSPFILQIIMGFALILLYPTIEINKFHNSSEAMLQAAIKSPKAIDETMQEIESAIVICTDFRDRYYDRHGKDLNKEVLILDDFLALMHEFFQTASHFRWQGFELSKADNTYFFLGLNFEMTKGLKELNQYFKELKNYRQRRKFPPKSDLCRSLNDQFVDKEKLVAYSSIIFKEIPPIRDKIIEATKLQQKHQYKIAMIAWILIVLEVIGLSVFAFEIYHFAGGKNKMVEIIKTTDYGKVLTVCIFIIVAMVCITLFRFIVTNI